MHMYMYVHRKKYRIWVFFDDPRLIPGKVTKFLVDVLTLELNGRSFKEEINHTRSHAQFCPSAMQYYTLFFFKSIIFLSRLAIDPLPCHPEKDQNISGQSGHIVLDHNVCVI